MGHTERFRETLRRLAMIDETFVEDAAGTCLDPAGASALDPRTAALVRLGALVATGASPVCLQWGTGRAMAAGVADDEIADVLLAVAPVAGLGRVFSAAPEVATALGYDLAAALEELARKFLRVLGRVGNQVDFAVPGHACRDRGTTGRLAFVRRTPGILSLP